MAVPIQAGDRGQIDGVVFAGVIRHRRIVADGDRRVAVEYDDLDQLKPAMESLDLDRLEELAVYVQEASLCGLGSSAPNPFMSTLRHFREDYESKMQDEVQFEKGL